MKLLNGMNFPEKALWHVKSVIVHAGQLLTDLQLGFYHHGQGDGH